MALNDDLARRTGRSKSFYVRTTLHEYLADLEDAFAADAAIDAFEAWPTVLALRIGHQRDVY